MLVSSNHRGVPTSQGEVVITRSSALILQRPCEFIVTVTAGDATDLSVQHGQVAYRRYVGGTTTIRVIA
jgi:hypothetical protein